MQYVIAFLEGIITFISPCLLPMLPIYLSYFAGGGERSLGRTLRSAFGFVTGFTLVFTALGALAGTVGGSLQEHQTAVNLVSGGVVILFGLNFLGVIRLDLFRGSRQAAPANCVGFFPALLLGIVFSVGWTPCVGAFLGSALMLLAYSLGLGIPFLLSAVLIDSLKSTFDWIKRHYGVINRICGGLLVLLGVLMATGSLGRLLALLN